MTTRIRPPAPPSRPPTPRSSASTPGGGGPPTLTPRVAMRIAILGGLALSLLGVLVVRLWFLQVIGGDDYTARAEENRLRTVVTEAPRGKILDRNGNLLVTNKPAVNVVADPQALTGERRVRVLTRLAGKVDLPARSLIDKVTRGESTPFEPVALVKNAKPDLARYLAEYGRDYPGVSLQNTYTRAYPQGKSAAQIFGQVGPITAENIDDYRERGYVGNESVGLNGVEAEYERFLRGTAGTTRINVDADGDPVGRGVVSQVPASPGRDVRLSIDLPTQRALQAALDEEYARNFGSTGAAGVALDPRTGEVLAMASAPSFDPSTFVDGSSAARSRLFNDEAKPLLNRAVDGYYPTGSTFKAVTATAALETGYITPDTLLESSSSVTYGGQDFSNFEGTSHGLIPLRTALEVSSDTFFYQLGYRFYGEQSSPLQDWASRYGFGKPTGIDLPSEQEGVVPTPAWKKLQYADPKYTDQQRSWVPGDTVQLAVGQGFFLATPLQLANAYAAVADGGTVRTPSLANAVLGPDGQVLQDLAAARPERALGADPANLEVIREGLDLAANGSEGTSTAVFADVPPEDRVAGKTGTAEPGLAGEEDHSWFVGYAPDDDPRLVVAAVIERAGTGANAAAPAVCQTMAANLDFPKDACGTAVEAEAN